MLLRKTKKKNESFIILIIKPFLNAADNLKVPLKSTLFQIFSRTHPQIAEMFVPFHLLYQHFRIIRNSKYAKVMEYVTLGTRLLYFTDLGTQGQVFSSQLLDGLSAHLSCHREAVWDPGDQRGENRPAGKDYTRGLVCAARGIWANGNHRGHACLEMGCLFKAVINPSHFSLPLPLHISRACPKPVNRRAQLHAMT